MLSAAGSGGIPTFDFGGEKSVSSKNDIIFFKSNLPGEYKGLSNFADLSVPLSIDGEEYPSVEHAFQAKVRLKPEHASKMQCAGELAKWDNWTKRFPDMRKPTHKLIGWMAKVAVNKINSKKLGLSIGDNFPNNLEDKIKLLGNLIEKKFSQEKEEQLLLKTGDKYILELDSRGGDKSIWGGKAVYAGPGSKTVVKIVGGNVMGKLLMERRSKILEKKVKSKNENNGKPKEKPIVID